jgi:flavin-dependent dehydrogenase
LLAAAAAAAAAAVVVVEKVEEARWNRCCLEYKLRGALYEAEYLSIGSNDPPRRLLEREDTAVEDGDDTGKVDVDVENASTGDDNDDNIDDETAAVDETQHRAAALQLFCRRCRLRRSARGRDDVVVVVERGGGNNIPCVRLCWTATVSFCCCGT